MIVDDEEIGLEMTASVLEADGYQVIKASSAKVAIELLEQNKTLIYVILMDLVMLDTVVLLL
jgi:CheY-like chemotaxis protein